MNERDKFALISAHILNTTTKATPCSCWCFM